MRWGILMAAGLVVSPLIAAEPFPADVADALQKTLFFYDAQRAGKLPMGFRIAWRGDSCMADGKEVGKDLTGGWFDAGDHVKTNVSIGYATVVLAWGLAEYPEAYRATGQEKILLETLRHSSDFLLKCFTNDQPGQYEFYTQVGKIAGPRNDHEAWASAEVIHLLTDRPSYKVTAQVSGTDVTGHAAAGLAAAAVVFRASDPAYADKLLTQARKLFRFADEHRGTPGLHVGPDGKAEKGGLYRDEKLVGLDRLAWAACWLHRAETTANTAGYDGLYLKKARDLVDSAEYKAEYAGKHWAQFEMNRVDKGAYLLLARLTGQQEYMLEVSRYLDWWTIGVGDKVKYTPGGLAWRQEWGVLRYTVNTSWFALLWSDHLAGRNPTAEQQKAIDRNRAFARRQLSYVFGDNPLGRSYVIGVGKNPWTTAHHRTAYGPWAGWEHLTKGKPEYDIVKMRHTLYGAMLGGPDENDQFTPDVSDVKRNEVALDYQAALTGCLARLWQDSRGQPSAGFPPIEAKEPDIYTEAAATRAEPGRLELRCTVNNRSAWPARVTGGVSFRYFGTLPAGMTVDGLTATAANGWKAEVRAGGPGQLVVEVRRTNGPLFPGGLDPASNWQPFYSASTTLTVTGPKEWDPRQDWSANWINGTTAFVPGKRLRLPVYSDGQLAGGEVP